VVIPEDLSSGAFPEKDTTPNAVTAMQALDDFLGFHFHYHTGGDRGLFYGDENSFITRDNKQTLNALIMFSCRWHQCQTMSRFSLILPENYG